MASDRPHNAPDDVAEDAAAILARAVSRPSVARCYDWLLGGDSNYAIDQEFMKAQAKKAPFLFTFARANRTFLGRAADFVVRELGIRQCVDIGSGLPTVGAVHEIAEVAAPGQVRVVYVDNEPVAQAHAGRLLDATADIRRTAAIWGDFLRGEDLWNRVMATGLIDPREPIALFLVALLHFMPSQPPEHDPVPILADLRDRLAPGSALILSHVTSDIPEEDIMAGALDVMHAYQQRSTHQPWMRTTQEIQDLFGDFELVEPRKGAERRVVWTPLWRPNPKFDHRWHPTWEPETGRPAESIALAGVGVKH